ncbi:hypothetical protein RCO27_03665 [Sphingosinicella sp. LHD-64]|uniref:hypothetical protein n=1 Tax=Sphingosinicella sp. LHD-64 TaxID=3072139 RepID=UPI00280ED75B|nr:hypothetical protein [Sphingosinicella sp. LHD-64]MDQ8755317.1 hypothetical protein [Sphingosinicella sp. LHD-64]
MTDDPRYRPSARDEERRSDSPLADAIEMSVRRIVTAIVLAGGLIGIGAYFSGEDDEAPNYQVTTTSDGRIVRLNTDSGSIVICQDNRCWVMQRGSRDLDDEPPAALPKQEARPALPAPAQAPDNVAAVPAAR